LFSAGFEIEMEQEIAMIELRGGKAFAR